MVPTAAAQQTQQGAGHRLGPLHTKELPGGTERPERSHLTLDHSTMQSRQK